MGGRKRLARVLVACVALIGTWGYAQNFPAKPIRVVVPLPPGGSIDFTMRTISERFAQITGQPFVLDNRAGASGIIAAEHVMKAPPDGYTLILVSGSYGSNAALHKLPYDSVTGIKPIILIGETGLIVTMHPNSPVKSIRDYIESARANPGKFNFGSSGTGGLGHMAGELFMLDTGVKLTHVPYKGTGPVMSALLAAEVHTSFSSMVPAIPHIRSGKLRPKIGRAHV